MEAGLLNSAKEIGIALTAVVGAGFLIKYIIDLLKSSTMYMVDKNKEVFDSLIKQLEQNRTDYSSFVESNNHGNTERIEKSTQAMVQIAGAIEQHTKLLDKLIERLEK